MPLRLPGSSSGYVEIDAPATAGNNTLKLPTGNGSAGQSMTTDGSGNLSFGSSIVSGTSQASTSGTSIDFTGIPSWVKRITVMFDGVSTNGTSSIIIQLGDSGGIETTGYVGSGHNGPNAAVSFTAGFPCVVSAAAALTFNGQAVVSTLGSNAWAGNALIGASSIGNAQFGAAAKTLSSTLDRVRITTVNGTDTFDAGTINIMYE